jgi:fucose 4-O-acetylase-like acetyltransferase
LDRAASDRITLIGFPLIVGVVFIHAYSAMVHVEQGSIGPADTGFVVKFVRDIVSGGIADIAVPLFYLLSGFLFFYGAQWTRATYAAKLRTRAQTLLVPYVAWNVLTVLLVAIAQAIPATSRLFSAGYVPIVSMNWTEVLDVALGVTKAPIAYQFWFIKDLMLLVIAAPLIHVLACRAGLVFLVACGGAWALDVFPAHALDTEAVLFFYLGALVALRGGNPFAVDRYGSELAAAYLVVVIADALTKGQVVNALFHKTGLVLGCAAALYWSRSLLAPGRRRVFLWLGRASFFVFAAHEPLLTALRKALYAELLPHSGGEVLALYFIAPLLVIAVCVGAYSWARAAWPAVTAILAGGR